MASEAFECLTYQETNAAASGIGIHALNQARAHPHDLPVAREGPADLAMPRRTPRKSLIFVMPGDRPVLEDVVTRRIQSDRETEDLDVIVAYSGEPRDLASLQRRVRDIQVLVAPAGSSAEDLRELAMERAAGDIVTLFSGFPQDRETDD
ncbi:MAG: hypothetical protein ACJ78M_00170 [Gemmatimonadaceae bacterium]